MSDFGIESIEYVSKGSWRIVTSDRGKWIMNLEADK
jgi:hypothetical protein